MQFCFIMYSTWLKWWIPLSFLYIDNQYIIKHVHVCIEIIFKGLFNQLNYSSKACWWGGGPKSQIQIWSNFSWLLVLIASRRWSTFYQDILKNMGHIVRFFLNIPRGYQLLLWLKLKPPSIKIFSRRGGSCEVFLLCRCV